MKINMNSTSPNFNGLLLYKNTDAKVCSTINTEDIKEIRQKYSNDYTVSDYNTEIILKDTTMNTPDKFPVLTFDIPIEDVIRKYNQACKNERAELGKVVDIGSTLT